MKGNRKAIIEFLLSVTDEEMYEILPVKEKRNLDQNAYYWKLVGLIAKSVGNTTPPRVHNELLRRNPVFEIVEGKKVTMLIADTDETAETVLNSTTYHLMPTTRATMGKDGQLYRYWWMLKGSHEMSKEEFSKLLDEALSECRELGVRIPEYEH